MKKITKPLIISLFFVGLIFPKFVLGGGGEPVDDPSLIGMFGISWKLFLAQLVNFSIVLFVLWKWVWKPVTQNMEARTQKIEDSLKNADQISKDKLEFDEWREAEISKTRVQATEILSIAKNQAESLRSEMLEKTKVEQAQLIEKAQSQLAQEKHKIINEAKSEIADIIIQSTEKLLKAKLDSKADQKLINDAIKGLK